MNPVQQILLLAVRVYRWTLSPIKTALLGPLARCRFTPSCSAYGLEAIRTHGATKGSWLALRRICRCHPWGGCGHDPVPEREFRVPGSRFPRGHPGGSERRFKRSAVSAIGRHDG